MNSKEILDDFDLRSYYRFKFPEFHFDFGLRRCNFFEFLTFQDDFIKVKFISAIPRDWIVKVCRNKGSNHLRVAICAYELFVYARKRGEEWFKITNDHARLYGLSSEAKNDGMKILKEMGLMEIQKREGRTSLVKLIF